MAVWWRQVQATPHGILIEEIQLRILQKLRLKEEGQVMAGWGLASGQRERVLLKERKKKKGKEKEERRKKKERKKKERKNKEKRKKMKRK